MENRPVSLKAVVSIQLLVKEGSDARQVFLVNRKLTTENR